MSELRLAIMTKDLSPSQVISCGVDSIDRMIREAYSKTVFKQGTAYNIYVDSTLVGSCMVRLAWLRDEDNEYYAGEPEYIAMEIAYIAIDRRVQGHGIGTRALKQLIDYAKKTAQELPIRFLILDAFTNKESWYARSGFKKYPKREDLRHPHTIPMWIDLMDTEAAQNYIDTLS